MEFSNLMDLLSWDIYTRFVATLQEYGFHYIPLLIFLYTHYIELLNNDSNTSISGVSISRMFNSVIIYTFILIAAFMPLMDYSFVQATKHSVYENKLASKTSALDHHAQKTVNTFNNVSPIEKIKMPILFALFDITDHVVVNGVKQAISKININDIRSEIATTMQNDSIKTPRLRRAYNKFTNTCYDTARNKLNHLIDTGEVQAESTNRRSRSKGTSNANAKPVMHEHQYDWAGGSYYMQTPGFYKPCPSGSCQSGIAPKGINILNNNKITPCDVMWNTLRPEFVKEFNIKGVQNKRSTGRTDAAIRAYLKAERTVDNEEGNGFGIIAALKSVVSWVVGLIGTAMTTFLKTITTYLITVVLPMVQALLLFVIVVLLPIVLPFSAMRIEYLFSIFMTMFAISFVSVIVAVIGLVDNALLGLMAANSGSDNGFMQALHIASSGNGLEFFLINLLILFFYIIAIKVWIGLMVDIGGKMVKNIAGEMTLVGDMDITSKVIK